MGREQEGIILSVKDDIAKVRSSRHSHCENCGSCPGDSAIVIEAVNDVAAKPGEQVIIELQEKNMLKAAFIVFVVPLVSMMLGAYAGGVLFSYWATGSLLVGQIAIGGLFFLLSICYIKRYERKISVNKDSKAVVKRRK